MNRNIYDDNVIDINSKEDLPFEKTTIDFLEKEDETIKFELGGDFWSFENGNLYQYADFISLRNNENPHLVLDIQNQESAKDYGITIFNALQKTDYQHLPNFTLQDREEYILGSNIKGAIKLPAKLERSLNKIQHKGKELGNDLSEPLANAQELKPIGDVIKSAVMVLSLFFLLFKKANAKRQKKELVKKILEALDNKELDINDVLSDKFIREEIPELEEIIKRYQKNNFSAILDKDIEAIVEDKSVLDVSDKIAETPQIMEEIQTKLEKNILTNLEKNEIQDFDFQLNDLFEKSNHENSTQFLKELVMDNLEDTYQNHPKISEDEYGIAIAFMDARLNKEDKQSFLNESFAESEKLSESLISNVSKVIVNIMKNSMQKSIKI